MTAGEAWLWGFFMSWCEKMRGKQLPLSLGGWLSLGLWYEGMPNSVGAGYQKCICTSVIRATVTLTHLVTSAAQRVLVDFSLLFRKINNVITRVGSRRKTRSHWLFYYLPGLGWVRRQSLSIRKTDREYFLKFMIFNEFNLTNICSILVDYSKASLNS